MVTFRVLPSFTAALVALSVVGSTLVAAVPLVERLQSLSPTARDVLKRTTPNAPYFQAYDDTFISTFPSTAQLQGFTVYTIAFYLTSGAADMALAWQDLGSSGQKSLLDEYHAAGISVTVSLFGSTDTPTTSGNDPTQTANSAASWVIQNNLDGVDVDYEDFNAFDANTGAAEQWLTTFTKQLRTQLPQGQYLLSHAPVAPWFAPNRWSGGGYLTVDQNVGSLIDWYNIQFYNQGASEYTTCSGLLTQSSTTWPQTALFQIAASGVDVNKLVIGKPATAADASNGYIDPGTLATCVSQAAGQGWNAGVMVWQYPHGDSAWITTVRGSTFPVSATPPSGNSSTAMTSTAARTATTSAGTATTSAGTATTSAGTATTSAGTVAALTTVTAASTTPVSTPTTTASAGCSGVSAWSTSAVYVAGDKVTYNGDLWTATQWNESEAPGGMSGAWNYDSTC